MKRTFLAIAAVFALSGTAHAQMTLQQQMEANRKAGLESCGSRGCVQSEVQPSQRDLDHASAYIMQRDEFNLRRLGMTPDTARKGMWAAVHKPDSACAGYIRQLTAEADAPLDAPAQNPESTQMLIMSIERSGTCERRNLD